MTKVHKRWNTQPFDRLLALLALLGVQTLEQAAV
jgi:hypothetical protein